MSKNISKPRYDFIKGLLSYEKPDLDRVTKSFIEWATLNLYLILGKENIFTHEREYKAVKGAKRGNDVYAWKVRKVLEHLNKLPDNSFFNFKDRNGVNRTKAIFITLTYRRFLRLDEAWERVGEDFNRWITGLRKQYGGIDVLRAWEAQSDGYPHIHCVLLFHDVEFETFFYNGKWRVKGREALTRNWGWGFSDVFALSSLGAGVGYVVKYVTKVNGALLGEKKRNQGHVLTLALMWVFKKRSFSVSKGFGELLVCEVESEPRGQVDLEGNTIYQWILVGFWADVDSEFDTWSVELTYAKFWKIHSSEYFTFNKALFSD